MIKQYYYLAKPGIIYGNAITATAGFFLAPHRHVNLPLFLAMLIGLSLIIAAGCVINNIIDRDMDARMERTKTRAIVQGIISTKSAIVYGSVLFILGFFTLYFFTNAVALSAAVLGAVIYLALYTPLKRRTVHATLIGAVAGAVPPIVGYTAITGRYDTATLLLLLILVCWQMPHFYAIAIYRFNDYKEANIPVWPIIKGVKSAKICMLLYIIAFAVSSSLLTHFHYVGYVYLTIVLALSLSWLTLGIKGFTITDVKKWGRTMFFLSLIVLTLFSVTVALSGTLHLP